MSATRIPMTPKHPLVSVVIAAYNVQDCLGRAVQSVLAGEFQDFEVLIVDDGSRDATLDVARQWAARDARIRVFSLGRNQGPSAARNRGIDEAWGQWVGILDADDAFLPHRLGQLMELAQRRGGDMVSDDLLLYDLGADQMMPPAFGWTEEQAMTLDMLLGTDTSVEHHPVGWVQPVWRVAFLRTHGLAYPTQYRYMEDFFLLASALICGGRIWLSPRAGYVYTLRVGPISRQASPHSATQAGLQDAGAVCQDLIARYRNILPRRQVRALRNVHRGPQMRQAMADAITTRREQGLAAALLMLRRHPDAAWRLAVGKAGGLANGLWRRLARKRIP